MAFIGQVWSARLNDALVKKLVFGNIVNHDYEGEIQGLGSTVNVNAIGDITVGNYTGAAIGAPEDVTAVSTSLVIDQAKFVNFSVDDVTKAQSNVKILDGAMVKAAADLANKMDGYIAGLYSQADAGNLIGNDTTPIAVTVTNAYDNLVDLGVLLDKADVPEEGRFVVIPPAFHGLLLKDPRFTKDANVMATGYIGSVDNMTVYKSNNVPNTAGAKYKVIAGFDGAISFAQQLDSIEQYRPEGGFKDAVKALQLYGAKVMLPKGIAVLTCNL